MNQWGGDCRGREASGLCRMSPAGVSKRCLLPGMWGASVAGHTWGHAFLGGLVQAKWRGQLLSRCIRCQDGPMAPVASSLPGPAADWTVASPRRGAAFFISFHLFNSGPAWFCSLLWAAGLPGWLRRSAHQEAAWLCKRPPPAAVSWLAAPALLSRCAPPSLSQERRRTVALGCLWRPSVAC